LKKKRETKNDELVNRFAEQLAEIFVMQVEEENEKKRKGKRRDRGK
jgi:hypothetical protein